MCTALNTSRGFLCTSQNMFSGYIPAFFRRTTVTSVFPSQRTSNVKSTLLAFFLQNQIRRIFYGVTCISINYFCQVIIDKSSLVQVMGWCHQAPSHYQSQCWLISMSPYGINRPQWVNYIYICIYIYILEHINFLWDVIGHFNSLASWRCSCHFKIVFHYCDAIMGTVVSQITSLTIVYTTVYSDPDQSKHQSSASLAFVWGIHRDRWIPRTKVQLRGKCFHLMTSSCLKQILTIDTMSISNEIILWWMTQVLDFW